MDIQEQPGRDAIHNPSNPDHFMWLNHFGRSVTVKLGDQVLAETINPVRVIEVGRVLVEPQLYLPRSDVFAILFKRSDTTHCPLKGDSFYFDLLDENGTVSAEKIAWSYLDPIKEADDLKGLIAFDLAQVSVLQSPV